MHNDRSSSNCQFIYPHDVISDICDTLTDRCYLVPTNNDKHVQSSFGAKLQEFTMKLLFLFHRVSGAFKQPETDGRVPDRGIQRNNDMVTRNDLAVEMLQMHGQWFFFIFLINRVDYSDLYDRTFWIRTSMHHVRRSSNI